MRWYPFCRALCRGNRICCTLEGRNPAKNCAIEYDENENEAITNQRWAHGPSRPVNKQWQHKTVTRPFCVFGFCPKLCGGNQARLGWAQSNGFFKIRTALASPIIPNIGAARELRWFDACRKHPLNCGSKKGPDILLSRSSRSFLAWKSQSSIA